MILHSFFYQSFDAYFYNFSPCTVYLLKIIYTFYGIWRQKLSPPIIANCIIGVWEELQIQRSEGEHQVHQ